MMYVVEVEGSNHTFHTSSKESTMSYVIETIKHPKGKIEVRDVEYDIPFEDMYGDVSHTHTIFKEMNHYTFGEEQTSNLKEWVIDKAREYDLENIIPEKEYLEDTEWSSDIEKFLEENFLFLPLTLYIHSGETINFGEDFNNFTELEPTSRYRNDGFVYLEKCDLIKSLNLPEDTNWNTLIKYGESEKTLRQIAEELLKDHAKYYRWYIEGDIREVVAIATGGEEIYYSGSFIGDDNLNELKEEAQKTLDDYLVFFRG